MGSQLYKSSPIISSILIFVLTGCAMFGGEDFSAGPLLTVDREEDSRDIEALGPFIKSKRGGGTREFGIRPFLYFIENEERDSAEFDLLYPLSTYDRRGEDWGFQFLVYLLSYESELTGTGFRESEFTFFPFIFSKSAEEREDSYFALFPLYGRMKDKYLKDEINFLLFPLYLETKSGESTNTSFLWPFFGYYSGGGQEGFRVWPVFGYRKKKEKLDEKFALWPIYISRKEMLQGEERRSLAIFPFYSSFESPDRTNKTYLWPLFNRLVDREEGITRWDVPWPLINFTRGKEEENRVFPFYAKETEEDYEQGFFLWPLYRYETLPLEDHIRKRKSFLLFVYADEKEIPTIEGGRSGRRIDLFPLFSYERDDEGNRHFHLLSILEPFLSNHEAIERNYAPFWRLFEWEENSDGSKEISLLWNLYRQESGEDGLKVSVQPIVPLFSYESTESKMKWDLLGGLFGYKSGPVDKTVNIFFIPVGDTPDLQAEDEGGKELE